MENILHKKNIINILIIGVGGGCDIFTTYSFYKYILSFIDYPTNIFIANTRRSKKDTSHLQKISKHIFELLPYNLNKVEKQSYKKIFDIELLPYSNNIKIVILPDRTLIDECNELIEELSFKKWDLIVSIDTGGDSICDDNKSYKIKDNRDFEMIQILKSVRNITNCLYYHVIFGLGCDGEYDKDTLLKMIDIYKKSKKYIGSFNITNDMYLSLDSFSKYFKMNRTINILLNNRYNNNEHVLIPRGKKYMIPTTWLKQFIILDFSL